MSNASISFDRYLTALHHQEPDRVPLGEIGVDLEVKEAFLGRQIRTLQDNIDFWTSAGYDYIVIDTDLYYASQQIQQAVLNPHPNTAALYITQNPNRNWLLTGSAVIRSWDDVERFPWPTADQMDYSVYTAAAHLLPSRMKVVILFGHIFTSAWQLMGFEAFCIASIEQPELIQNIIDRLGAETIRFLERVLTYDCVGAVCASDDIAYNSGLMVSPKHLRKVFFPWLGRFAEVAHAFGRPLLYHTDGDVSQVIPDIIAAEVDALHPIEPQSMDILAVKKAYGDRLTLIGNVDLGYTLTRGTPQDVENEVRHLIKNVASGGGYLLSSANSITNYVPLENYRALLSANLKYGRYPISI